MQAIQVVAGVYSQSTAQIDGKAVYSGTPNDRRRQGASRRAPAGARLMFDYSQPCRAQRVG